MRWKRFRISLRTWLALVALASVFASVVSREARQQRGWVVPGDILIVEVLEAPPGHPITGEHPVLADGCIDLGHYGSLSVGNRTLSQIKTKLISRLRTYLSEEQLGLLFEDDSDGESAILSRVDPADSDRVFVDSVDRGITANLPESFLDYVNTVCQFESDPPLRFKFCGRGPIIPSSPTEQAIETVRANSRALLGWLCRPFPLLTSLYLLTKSVVKKRRGSDSVRVSR